MKVNGEEDLAVLPIILAAPLGVVVLYGQPQKAAVSVTVTEQVKENVVSIVRRFISQEM